MSLAAELDTDAGAVVLPYDRFTPSYVELSTLAAATAALIMECAREQGVDAHTGVPPTDPVYSSGQYFGPWTQAQAETFAFVRPQTQADMHFNGVTIEGGTGVSGSSLDSEAGVGESGSGGAGINSSLTDADWEIIDGCGDTDGTAELKAAQSNHGPWTSAIDAIDRTLTDQAAVKDAVADLDACYRSSGLTPETEAPWTVVGADPQVISEAQITLALTTVDCKKQTDFTRRVADAHAALQAPVILTYLDELVKHRQDLDRAVQDGRTIIAEHPEVFVDTSTGSGGSKG